MAPVAVDIACEVLLVQLQSDKSFVRACLRRSTTGGEGAPLLAGGGASAGDPAGDGVDRGPADHCLGDGGVAFVVTGQAAVRGQPGERPLDRPPARDHGESSLAGGLAHDMQGGGQDRTRPVQESAGEPAVGEDEPVLIKVTS